MIIRGLGNSIIKFIDWDNLHPQLELHQQLVVKKRIRVYMKLFIFIVESPPELTLTMRMYRIQI